MHCILFVHLHATCAANARKEPPPRSFATCIFHKACCHHTSTTSPATKCWQFYSLCCNFSSNFIFNSVFNLLLFFSVLLFCFLELHIYSGQEAQAKPKSSPSKQSARTFWCSCLTGLRKRRRGAGAGAHLDGFTFGSSSGNGPIEKPASTPENSIQLYNIYLM